MAQKVRVFTLASEFGFQKEEMVAKIQQFGFVVRNYMSGLDADAADKVRELLKKEREANTVEVQVRPTVVKRRTTKIAPVVKPVAILPEEPDDTPVSAEESGAALPNDEAASGEESTNKESDSLRFSDATEKEFQEAFSEPVTSGSEQSIDHSEAEQSDDTSGDAAAEQRVFIPLRPSSEAPLVRRRITASEADDNFKGSARRRAVESREMGPGARTMVPTSRLRTAVAPVPVGRKRRMTPGKKGKKTEITTPKAIKRLIRVEGQITLQELAKRMSVKATELLMSLMSMGMSNVNINSTLDIDTSKIVAEEFGFEVADVAILENELLAQTRADETEEEKANRVTRAPIVTMMGHVDHGKTSLLDFIRKANVAEGEAGGITQHIGAYRVKTSIGEIAFIDTPGHAAFTAMRARGADATDIVIVVCAADDGVMPQTIEAINLARAASCPIIVAINKCDLPSANVDKAKRGLLEQGLISEDLGGETIVLEVSAKTGKGIEHLLEMISLQAEVMELTANPGRAAAGIVLEAYLDKGRGPVSHVLVQDGTLSVNDIVVAGQAFGKVRAMTNERGQKVAVAGPSTPVEILGLSAVPGAGDTFDVVADMRTAEKVSSSREDKERATSTTLTSRPSLDVLYQKMQEEGQAELKVIVKADVRGTMEAIRESLTRLTTEKVRVTIVAASVGAITESDVLLASTANAIIVGFNVRPAGKARRLAEEQGIQINIYSVIYEILDSIEAAMKGLLTPTIEQKVVGMAEVREVFRIPKVGTIAGCYVTDGKVFRNGLARLIRDSVQIWEGSVDSLRRFKEDVKEVASGYECGIGLRGFNDIKEADVIEFYQEEEVETQMN
jgi:translation initiation factor IF-2